MPTRRRFLELSAAAAGAFGLSPLIKIPLIGEQPDTYESLRKRDVGRARVPLNILILGGTGFTGPEQVEYAIARGHRVTLFNRGKTRPGVFKGKVAEELIGDLNSDTSALEGKKFDVVIDNPTTLPFWVKNAAKYLAGNTKHYIFISTTSVYADQSQIGINESSPRCRCPRGSIRISPINATSASNPRRRIPRTTAPSRRAPSRKWRCSIQELTR
jgi:2'-hydroxyisoflavone reductase